MAPFLSENGFTNSILNDDVVTLLSMTVGVASAMSGKATYGAGRNGILLTGNMIYWKYIHLYVTAHCVFLT